MIQSERKMDGLRQRQRRSREARILASAREAFIVKGRTGATIEEISAQAEVSALTVYTYFGDKDALFVRAWTQALEADHADRLAFIGAMDEADPLAALDAYLTRLMRPVSGTGLDYEEQRKLWCDFYAASYSAHAKASPDVARNEDRMILAEIEALFGKLQARNAIRPSVAISDLAEIVLAIGNLHWTRRLTGEDADDVRRRAETLRQTRLFVAPHLGLAEPTTRRPAP